MAKMTLFYGMKNENGCFSNFYPCKFVVDGIEFKTSEQYFMYRKAVVFGDMDIAKKILQVSTGKDAKALGRKVKNYDNVIWNGCRQIAMYQGCLAKFSQNEELKEKLLSTGDTILVEASPRDKIWGIGMSEKNPDSEEITKWNGKNLLGFTLMAVRDELQKMNRIYEE